MRDLRLSEILGIAAAIYAVWTPAYFLAKPGPVVVPTGARVDRILPTGSFDEKGRAIRGLGFRQRDDEVESPFVIYENETPLPSEFYTLARFNPKNRWREVSIRSSDGTDPKHNGRRYYAVIPDR